MAEQELPEDVRAFLREHIESYEQLETLLFLHRGRDRPCSADEISRSLRVSPELTAAALEVLRSRGLARVSGRSPSLSYVYSPPTAAMSDTIERLAQKYQEAPIWVIKLMSANAIERVRTAALHTFADAFILGKDKNRG